MFKKLFLCKRAKLLVACYVLIIDLDLCGFRSPHTPRVEFNGYREYGLRASQNSICLTTKFCEQNRVLT